MLEQSGVKSEEHGNGSNDNHAKVDTKGRCKANSQKVGTKGRGSESNEKHQAPVRGKKEAKVETRNQMAHQERHPKVDAKGRGSERDEKHPKHPDMNCGSSSALRCVRIAGQRPARYDVTAPCAERGMCPRALRATGS